MGQISWDRFHGTNRLTHSRTDPRFLTTGCAPPLDPPSKLFRYRYRNREPASELVAPTGPWTKMVLWFKTRISISSQRVCLFVLDLVAIRKWMSWMFLRFAEWNTSVIVCTDKWSRDHRIWGLKKVYIVCSQHRWCGCQARCVELFVG